MSTQARKELIKLGVTPAQIDGVSASEAGALAAKVAAESARDAALSAKTSYVSTKAAGNTLAATLPNGATVVVDADESATPAGAGVRYTVSGGTLINPSVDSASQSRFTPAGTGSIGRSVQEKLGEVLSILDFGAIGDGSLHTVAEWIAPGALARYASLAALQVDYPHVTSAGDSIDWAALQALVNYSAAAGKPVRSPAGMNLVLNKNLTVSSNMRITFDSSITAGSQLGIIDLTNANDVQWIGSGTITGDNATAAQNGVQIHNASRNHVQFRFIKNTKNKGVSITGNGSDVARDNHVTVMEISGCNGTSGAGVSIFGANATRNTLYQGYFTANRIGITINGGQYNTVLSPQCVSNTIAGLMIDGIVTASGDGGKYNTVQGGTYNSNGSASYGGIYLGNGSSWNKFVGVTCQGNSGAGVRISAGVGYECDGNEFTGVTSIGNATNGVTMSYAPRTRWASVNISGNTGRGFTAFQSDYVVVVGGEIRNNTTEGVNVQSGYSKLLGLTITGNNNGYQVAFGGSADSSGNALINSYVSGNTTSDCVMGSGLSRLVNCTGSITLYSVPGDANYSYSSGLPKYITYDAAITTTRAVALSAAGNAVGDEVYVTRKATATGASNINVGTGPLKALAPGQWCTVFWNGSAWELRASGSL